MIKIALDPGHGNRNSITGALDCGAVGMADGKVVRKESEHQLLFAARIRELLLTQPDIEVVMLRTTNDDKNSGYQCNLDYRISKASSERCVAYVSLHENASLIHTAQGYEIYTQTKPTTRDAALAQSIYDAVTGSVPVTKRGVKKKGFRVCKEPDMPSCLVETLFIDNTADRSLFDQYFDLLSLSTAKGILAGVGIQWHEVPAVPDEPAIPAEPDYKTLYTNLCADLAGLLDKYKL